MKNYCKSIILSFLALVATQTLWGQKGIIDKVVAVVGGEAILLSDIENELYTLKAQGMLLDESARCEVLEKKLVEKILLAQARVDSLEVNTMAVNEEVDRRFNFFVSQMGSVSAVEKYYSMPERKLKDKLRDLFTDQSLAQQMQGKIMQTAELNPKDVKTYFEKLPKDSLPQLPAQYILQQIVVYPPAADANFLAREQLLSIRERILNGEKFSTLAIMYSEDTESAKRGGELGLKHVNDYLPAFANAAGQLKAGQVSQIVETEYGLHIIQMIDKQSNELINVRHILISPKYSLNDKQVTTTRLDSIKNLILHDSLTFERAALIYSQEPISKIGGGVVVNSATASNRFDKDQLQPADYFMIKDLTVGEFSEPYESRDEKGRVVYKFVRVKEIVPSHKANIADDFAIIKRLAENDKQMRRFTEWLSKKQAATFIRIDPEFRTCKFDYVGWIK